MINLISFSILFLFFNQSILAYDNNYKNLYEIISKENFVFNVIDYGAVGDGTTNDTPAFEEAWKKACNSSFSSSTLLVPNNKKYLLKPPINFSGPCKSTVTFRIEGTLEAPSDPLDWRSTNQNRWIYIHDVNNLFVNGGGTINGNGKIWWENSCKINPSLPCRNAPTAMTFSSCKDLNVNNLNFINSQQIHVSIESCKNVIISSLVISAPSSSPNTDGIHVAQTESIQITNCNIQTGDDCISIVSGSKNVECKNIQCGPGHGISIGSLGGKRSRDQVSNVTIDSVQINGAQNGARIKTWQGGDGYAKDIKFKNIIMNNVKNPIIIDQNYCDSKFPCKTLKSAVKISNVLYKNITGTSLTKIAMNFNCSASVPCTSLQLENINLVQNDGNEAISACQNAKWNKNGQVVPTPCKN